MGRMENVPASGAAERLQHEQLRGYAPELNPNQGIWKHLKYVKLKNVCCRSLLKLKGELRRAKERLRHQEEARQPRLHQAAGLRCLDVCAQISNIYPA